MTFVQSIGDNCHVGKVLFKTYFMYKSAYPVQVKSERSKTNFFFVRGASKFRKKQDDFFLSGVPISLRIRHWKPDPVSKEN